MSNIKTYKFGTKVGCDDHVVVKVCEIYSTDYSNFVWQSAIVLSQFICDNNSLFTSKTVLELGSGTGICGIVAAKLGCKVILTDKFDNKDSLELCNNNVILNDISNNVRVMPLHWNTIDEQLNNFPQINYIIGSDCFYDEADFDDLLCTVSFFLENSLDKKNARFYTAYKKRCTSWSIECLLKKWNLTCKLNSYKISSFPSINIFEIRKVYTENLSTI